MISQRLLLPSKFINNIDYICKNYYMAVEVLDNSFSSCFEVDFVFSYSNTYVYNR